MADDTRTMKPIATRPADSSSAGLVLLYADPLEDFSTALVSRSPFVIGREPPPGGLQLRQGSASRTHARLARHGDQWTIADLGSRNGTFVDGRRVTAETPLAQGSVIRIGDALLKFVTKDAEDYARYRIDGSLAPGAARRGAVIPELVGGREMDRVAASIEAVARTDLAVLVRGETGTGKELVVRAVHRLSGRPGRLCAINCAAVPANLFESELFGFRRGAFTGADHDKPGIVQAAHGGTLFLDEIGEMSLEAQAKLLRVLEAREVLPVGATKPEPVDVRVACATHRDLQALVAQGAFRGDLYARLDGYEIVVPPLRERKEDLFPLVLHFLNAAEDTPAGRSDVRVTFGFMLALCDYEWPYNVRECEAAVRRARAIAVEPTLGVELLPDVLRARTNTYGARALPSDARIGRAEPASPEELRALLERHSGNVAAAARALGKDPAQLYRWMRRHGVTPADFRK